jgi:hypothetical protein
MKWILHIHNAGPVFSWSTCVLINFCTKNWKKKFSFVLPQDYGYMLVVLNNIRLYYSSMYFWRDFKSDGWTRCHEFWRHKTYFSSVDCIVFMNPILYLQCLIQDNKTSSFQFCKPHSLWGFLMFLISDDELNPNTIKP